MKHRPTARVEGISARLHLLCGWDGLDERAVAHRAAAAGVAVMTVADYRIAPGPGGLVIGYGNILDNALETRSPHWSGKASGPGKTVVRKS